MNVETRKCRQCSHEYTYTTAYWPMQDGAPHGDLCRLCSREKERAKKTRARGMRAVVLAALAESPPKTALPAVAEPEKLPTVLKKLEASLALRAGSDVLNKNALKLLKKVVEYGLDPQSLHHEWALKLLSERLLPRKLYEELGLGAAGVDPKKRGENARPSVTIIVQPALPTDKPIGTVVVEGASERVGGDDGSDVHE